MVVQLLLAGKKHEAGAAKVAKGTKVNLTIMPSSTTTTTITSLPLHLLLIIINLLLLLPILLLLPLLQEAWEASRPSLLSCRDL